MPFARSIMTTVALLALAACATPTPYQPRGPQQPYGYAERRIEPERIAISFSGNSLTERETVETYLLFRAAELTLQNGYDHFIVTDRAVEAERRLQSVGRPYHAGFFPSYHYFSPRFGWRPWYDPFWADPIDLREVSRYEATAEILMRRGPKPDDAQAFDARAVVDSLRPTVVLPPNRG